MWLCVHISGEMHKQSQSCFAPKVAKGKMRKTSFIKFRISLTEKMDLKKKANKAGISLSEYCRKAITNKEIKERLSNEQIVFYKVLIRYHNNFKSIANLYKHKDPGLASKVNELADELKNHLKNFKS